MRKRIEQWCEECRRFLPATALLLLLVLLCKQLGMFGYLTSLYHACIPVLSGVVIAFLLQPLIDRMGAFMSHKKAVMLVYFGLFLFLCLLLVLLLPMLYQQLLELAAYLPSLLHDIQGLLDRLRLSLDLEAFLQKEGMDYSYDMLLSSMQGLFSSLTAYGIAYITAFFLSMDLPFWKRCCRRLCSDTHRFATFYHTMSSIIYQYLCGTFLDLCFISISTGVVLLLFSFPHAIMYAILLALLNLFPYIGATIGLLLIALVAFLQYDSFPWLMFAIVWTLQQLEANFIQPLIFHHTMHVRPLLTFAFLFIGDALCGLPGVILSPILAAMAQIAFRSWLHARSSDEVGVWEDIWVDFDAAMKEEQR